MKLTGLPSYQLNLVVRPVEANGTNILWLENGDVEITNATEEQIDLIKRAIYVAAGVVYPVQEAYEAKGIAKTWFAGQQAAIDFVRQTPAQQSSQIDAMTLAQLRTVVKYLTIAVSMLIKRELL